MATDNVSDSKGVGFITPEGGDDNLAAHRKQEIFMALSGMRKRTPQSDISIRHFREIGNDSIVAVNNSHKLNC